MAESVVWCVPEQQKQAFSPAQTALLEKYQHLLKTGFRGAYQHGIDSKGRMIVPAPFREALGTNFRICRTPDFKAIAIFPEIEWQLYYCSLLELAEKDMRALQIVEMFSFYTYDECELDGQGRVLLPQKLRNKYLKNVQDVQISGAGNHIRVESIEEAEKAELKFERDIPDILAFEAEIARR